MKKQTKKAIALLLVLVQLFVLFPVLQPQAKAAQMQSGQTPELNETIVGTLKFQSFNLLGSNSNDRDEYYEGVDYTSTFYYSDDYFAGSAANPAMENTATARHEWHELENQPLAALSAAFALASFTSNKGNCVTRGGYSWNNTDYTDKDSNAKAFFRQCGFASSGSEYQQYELLKAPGMDTIGCVISSKTIRVWDPVSGTNKPYTLIAVGVRGAGYGAEWANNVTIGNPKNNTHEMPGGRHWGFETSAQEVCDRVYNYLTANNITGDVKYWVTGFSRAGAVANLVAGKLTDNAGHEFGGSKDNVFGYTWECPQAASVNDPALSYTNIHNILNPMDAVPKVSPDEFEHQRLGIDYRMPYYGNTDADQNTELYNRMYDTLKTIAVGTYINGTFKEDDLIKAVDPTNYPYNRALPLYTISFTKLISDAASDNLKKNFGTEEYTGSGKIGGGNYMLDQYIDSLIDVFLTSPAWTNANSSTLVEPSTNLNSFLNDYQQDFRTLFGYLLDFSGPAFMDMIDEIIAAVQKEFGIEFSLGAIFKLVSSAPLAVAFYEFYDDPNGSYGSGFFSLWPSAWKGKTHKEILIKQAQSKIVDIVNTTTNGYNNSSISRQQMNSALQRVTGLVVNLYSVELDQFHSQYFGTTLHYLNEILSTHEQETVLSWIMSLDENHINRSCRTITVPRDSNVKLLEFRPEYDTYDGTPQDADAKAPAVAEWSNGTLTTKDARISSGAAGSTDYVVIRYPASLNIRVDVTSDSDLPLANIGVDDYQTTSATINVSAGANQYSGVPSQSTAGQKGFNYVTTNPEESNAAATNTALSSYGTLQAGDTLHVIANPTEKFDDTMTYDLLIDKAPKSVVTEYTIKTVVASNVDVLSDDTDTTSFGVENRSLIWTGSTASESGQSYTSTGTRTFKEYDLSSLSQTKTARATGTTGIDTRHTVTVTPAASIYYDDTLLASSQSANAVSGTPDYQTAIEQITNGGTQVDESKLLSFKFTGTRVDLYMNTTEGSGSVIAYLLDENGVRYDQGDGTVTGKIVSCKSENDLYNVPTVSFSGLNHGTYTLAVAVPANKNYTLDGVRVYDESKASYASVRETLLGLEDWKGDTTVSGTVYLDYNNNGNATRNNYETAGPKGEVYLKNGNGVAFTIDGYSASANYRIGMSAVNGTAVNVDINGEPYTVSATTHMFYDLHPTSTGNVVIRVTGGNGILSVTDVEEVLPTLTGTRRLSFSASPELMLFAKSLSAVPEETPVPEETTAPVETAAPEETTAPTEDPVVTPTPVTTPSPAPTATPEPTPTPTNPSSDSSVMQLISGFVKSLFGGFSRLFRP